MVVSPGSSHSLRVLVIRDDVVVVGELFMADGTYPLLLDNFSVQQFPHLRWRPELPISPWVLRIVNALNAKP
jgi:hypothetical protein